MTKFRTLVCLVSFVLVLSLACPVQAVDNTWNDSTSDHAWNTAGNWTGIGSGPAVPVTGDGANIWIYGDVAGGGPVVSAAGMTGYGNMAMIRGANLTVDSDLTIDYAIHIANDWEDSNPTSTIDVDGTLNVDGYAGVNDNFTGVYVGSSNGFYWTNIVSGQLNVNAGGTANLNGLFIGNGANATGHVQLDNGVINTALFDMAYGGGTATMDITGTGTMIINGDVDSAIAGFITSGWLTAGAGVLSHDYDVSNSGQTTVFVVPEPTSGVFLLGLAGVALMGWRRRRAKIAS